MKKVLKSLQKDVLNKPRRFFSPDRHRTRQQREREEERGSRSNPQTRMQWREPSPRTSTLIQEIYTKLFTDQHQLNIDFIEKTLTLCPPDEDILMAEDRDHYNLIHKVGHNSGDHYNIKTLFFQSTHSQRGDTRVILVFAVDICGILNAPVGRVKKTRMTEAY